MEAPEDALLEAEPLPTDASDDDADAPASSGPASTPTSSTSSPPAEPPSPRSSAGQGFGPLSGPSLHSQSPHSGHAPARRGPGRPRKDPARPVRRYRTPMGSMRGFKRHRGSRDDSLEDLFDDVDLLASTPEEPPYFPEKWPGKVCALCNLSQRSQLGQGEMLQINCDVSGGISPGILAPPLSPSSSTPTTPTSVPSQNTLNLTLAAGRRQKNINKCKMPSSNPEHTDELSIIGYPESMEIMAVVDCGYLYLHKGCMDWSSPAESQAPGTLEIDRTIKIEDCLGDVDEGVKSIVAIALQRKCSFCLRWGASISCRMSCTKYFHYPCVLASGGFQEITTKSSFCKEHVYQVPLVCSADIDCHTCGLLGDIANLMTCCSCNAHHHGTCVGLPQLPGVRAGWNCKQCRVCQVCHGVGTDSGESKAIGCEQCDKLYHASCIRPIMTTIPKYGWKCKCCRVCSDCGSRSPGAGASSRWHAHYTVCDSCYQQRNKGLSCPLCRRAYRAAAQREMVQCSNCKRFVHGTCDADADLKTYQQKKETIPEYDYVCPVCTTIGRTPLQRRKDSIDDENLSASQESLYDDVIMDQDPLAFESKMDIGLGKGKPYSASKIAKKKIGAFKFRSNYGGSTTGKLPFNKRQRGYFMDFGRKRGAKTRMRGMFGIPGLGLQRPQAPDNKNGEDEPGVENKLVLCSSKDKFVLTQDVCVMCGALGTDSEGILIACAQCGQTYHPYCVSVKVTSVIVQKGWRCLDCTACEGCGRRDDEARLVLCDDCDVSFHTYCARPTLPAVPRGCWRCTRCRRCITCGTTQPGPDNMWMNGYTECGPCASLVMCAVCGTPYGDGELILQCAQCRRWLHAACDTVHSEQEADICCQRGYSCLLCRPRECPPPHLVPVPTPVPALPAPALTSTSLPQQALTPARPASPGEYFLDGVCLSAGGLRAIRALQGDGSTALGALHGRKKRRQRFEGPFDKSAGMCLYKEGMIWIVAQDGPPPEGFTTYTTESGKTVLRRKRQRNLNRVGIGGFTVRVRSQGRGSRGGEGELPPNSSEGPDSVTPTGNLESPTSGCIGLEKRKKPRRKPRSRLMEAFPSYMQEAFFGRDLLDLPGARIGELDTSINVTDSEGEDVSETLLAGGDNASTINLNQDELLAIEATRIKEEKEKEENDKNNELYQNNLAKIKVENESEDVSGNDLHVEDVKSIKDMILSNEVGQDNPDIESITAMKKDPINTDVLNSHQKDGMTSETNAPSKEDMSILGVNLENMVRESLPNMDSRDVEEIFKGVLTDDSQESQESSVSFVNSVSGSSSYNPQRRQLSSPMEFPSPYHTEYSGSSQLSPAFSESSGQWSASGTVMNSSCATGNSDIIGTDSSISQPPTSQTTQPTTYNQRSTEKMKADEGLGSAATISAVLYANINYPEWKTEFPNWPDRCKQILKKWRALASDKKTPYLQQARDNRGAIRMKKAQQISKESNAVSGQAAPEIGVPTAPAELPATLPDQSAEVPLDKDGLNLTHASATNTPSPAIVPQAPSPDSNTFNKSSSPVTTNTVTSSSSVVTGFTSGHFTLNHQFMPFYHGSNGPAPNVTVNPFGKFTTAGGGTHHKTIGRSITPSTTPGPHLTLGIVQQAQAQTPAASLVRHNITGALFSQALSFLGKSHVLPHSISSIMHSGGSTHKGVADGNCDNAVRSRSSSPMSPCGDVISDSTPLTSAPASAPPSPPGDLHIRVLTPSEIMRTLPSMPQELAYEPPIQTTEQEKLSGQQRGVREAEQERQWKQLQQLRQQQQQHQQQVIHDQRLQAMARVQRQINTDGSFPSEQLQVSINEQSPLHPGGVTSHSPTMPRSPYPSTNNVGRFTHPPLVQARPPTAPQRLVQSPFSPQSPHDPFPGSVSPAQNQSDPFQRPPSENSGEYLHSPQTPRSFGHQSPNPARSPAYANQTRMVTNINSQENYTQPPGTPRPGTQYSIVPQRNQIYAPRPQDPFLPPAQNPALLSPRSEGSLHPPEVNRQLRDLLQRQQNPSNKIWSQGDDQSITNQHSIEQQQITEGQFRQPLPVSPIVRPRVPVAPQEPRTRLILQNTPGGIQQQQQQRMLSPLQQQQLAAAAGHAILNVRSRTPVVESPKQQSQNTLPNTHPIIQGEKNILVNAHQPPKVNMGTPSPLLNNSNQKGTSTVSTQQINNSSTPIGNTSQSTEEMPDMDIDKLEQDNANMAEVGDLLGGLGDDEEELLVSLTAEMGDDFNILEYADPELADFGDTSNILDGLELTDDSDTTQGKHVKRDPVEDSSEETKSNIKHDSPIIKAEKKEEEESTGDKRVKLEPNIEGETNENQSIQIIHQKQELVESGVSAQHVTLPRLDIIHSTQPQSSSLSQNPSLIQNQHMRFQQTFRTNIAPTHLQVQGKLQQSQPNQFGLAQKIGNRQMGQIINVNQQNQFNQMNINKQTAVVVGQQTNIPVNQNQQVISTSQHHQIVQQIIARQTDQSQSLEQLTQHSQNQVQFTPNQQQIRGQFVPPQQQLAQLQQQAAIQQQMQSQVAAAIASGRPMAPGTRLMSPDGAVGVVTSNNSVTVTYPSAFAHHRPQHGRVGVGMGLGIRNVVRAAPPPPPPPYPGTTQRLQAPPPPPPPPYPSQEQPLLLEDLVEQEKREQGRQVGVAVESSDSVSTSSSVSVETSTPQQQWQQPTTPTTPPQQPQVGSVPLYNIPHLAAPPLPPERITTDSDRQAQLAYEQWLQGQNTLLTHQLKYYETEVQKLRKIRKSLNSKQRQLRKSGNELAAGDAAELARISGEQAVLQKHLESARKQCRQHSMLIQEYRNKQQQQTQIQQSGGIIQQQINIVQGNITQQQSSVGQQQQQSNIVQQINVNQQQININQPQINTGQQQINTGQQQINTGKQHINTGKQINTVQQQINTVQQQINTGQQQINTGQQINMGQQINTGQQQINIGQQVNMVQQMNIGQVNVNQVNNGKGIFNQVLTQMQQQQSQQQQHQQQHQQHQQQHQQQQQQQISLMQTLQHTNSNQTQLMQQQVNQQNQVAQQLHLSQQTQNQINQQHGSIIQQQRINVMNPINQVVQQSQGNQQIQQISVSNQSSSPQMQTHLQIVNQQQQIIGIHQQNQLDKLTGNQTLHQINQLQNLSQGQRPMSSPSPQMTVQLQQNIQSPVTSHSPQLQSMQSGSLSGGASPHTGSTPPPSFSPQSGNGGRSPQVVFPRPQGSPLQNRFVRPPTHHGMHQQGMRVGVTFNTRQSSPLGSPQPLMSPGASQNETQRQQMMQRQQYSPMGQPPSSPLSRSPLIGVQPPSSPMSVRSPLVTTQTTPSPSPQPDSMSGGGGNPHALHNPIPLPPNLSTYRYFKLGLRGGSPMWGHNKPMKRLISNDPTQGSSNQQADQGILGKPKKESHLNKVSILKKKSQTKVSTHNVTISNVKNKPLSSFANMECNELDDSSCTPPVSPGKMAQTLECTNEMKGFEKPSSSEEPKMNMKKVIPEKNVPLIDCIQQSDEEIVLIESSPDENKHQILDYDDENDKNFVGAEVSLSAAAGDSDQGDLSVLEPFPQVEITEIASPLDSQEYILFSSDVVDYAVDSDDSLKPISFIQKDDSVVISYSRQTSESNGESNMHSPLEGSEDENNCIHTDEIIEKSSPTQTEKNSIQIEDVNHESIDSEIVVISSNVGSPEEHIATEEDFEELIDSGKPEDSPEGEIKESPSEKISLSQTDPPTSTVTRTETTKKTVAVISLAAKPPQSVSGLHQFKIVNTGKPGTGIARLPLLSAVISPHSNTKILNEVSQATVASVSIANQTISVPVLKSLNVPIVPLSSSSQGNLSPVSHLKKVPITITASSLNLPSKPISSVISVISSNIPRMAPFNPVITLATTNPSTTSRMPIPIITQKHIQQKIVKALDKPTTLTISSSKLSSLAVSQDVTLPAKIFQDESASPDSSLSQDESNENDGISSELSVHKDKATKDVLLQSLKKPINTLPQKSVCSANQNMALASQSLLISNADHSVKTKDVDIENEITKHTELPQKSLLLSKLDIPKSPERISEKIPDNIMEGDDEKVTKSDECEEPSKYLVPNLTMQTESVGDSNAKDSSILSNMKTNNLLNANPSKDMVLDSNMGISSELTQDSIQISIPSPTSSQERYLDNITLQAHNTELNNTVSISQKQVQQFKEMIDIWNNISGEPKVYPIKLQDHNLNSPQESSISAMLNRDNDSISDIDDIIRQDLNNSITTKPEHNQEALKSTIPVHVIMRTRESSQSPITVATSRITTVMPQLSPLSKPTELTTNIANASQQLRTIMSSINTSKVESTVNSTVTFMKKGPSQDLGTTTQVNFENLLPSTKVEVMAGKCTNRCLIEKAVLNSINSTTENSQSISSIIATSRISSLTTSAAGNINRNQHSPLQSPSGSPRHSPLLPAKSPIHSPLLMGQSVSEEQPNITSQTPPINQQAIQMPALSKIPTNSSQALSTVIQTNVPNSTTSILHKNQLITTNILSSTLLQTAGRHNQNNMQIPVHSLSQPPALIMSSRPATILSTNQISNLTTSNTNSITITSLAQSIKTQSGSNIISSKLLHSQLTSPLKRSKSTDEPKTEITSGQMQPNKRHSLESVIVKSEPMDCDDINSGLQSLENSGCKFSSLNLPQKPDESQNVLLKQLLQSSGGNSPTVTPARTSVSSLLSKQRTAPTLGLVPSLEAQLARPLIPPPHLPITTTVEPAKTSPRQTVSRETSFVPRMPQATSAPMVVTSVPMTTQSSTHSLMDVRKPPNKPIIKEEPPSTPTTTTPTTPMSISSFTLTGNEILSPTIKKEVIAPQQSPVNQPFVPLEVKKELLDESSQQSAISGISTVSDQGKLDTPLKEELSDTPNNIDTPIESGTNQETALEAKKRKRREYQQKRRQMQNNQKIEANNNKKRPRKGSKVEEDYDTYIDSLMNQLRQLPPMQVQEPMLGKNYGVCPVFGSGDLSKIGIMKDYSIKYGDLNGEFGNAYIPNITDFYNTKPFGEEESIPEKPPISTQRGFYDQEFSPIRLDSENDEKKMEFICKERDIDTPDTIVSSSSPECCVWDNSYPFPGLKLIDESESDEEVERSSSPIIPIITPIPIRVKSHQCDIPQKEMEKENVSANVNKEMVSIKSKVIGTGPSTENEENVTVTLTLTSAAAEDILGVLRELAGILHIPPPTAYQIVERTTTPPSHKLGLYRSKGKDGKEGAPIDIQSILNGEAKFCRHCDVVIMDSVIKAKASEFPLLSSFKSTSNDLLGDVESDLFFCSTQCYKRFAWTPTNIIVDNKSNMKFQENENSIIPNMDIKVKDDFDAGSVESMDTEDVDLKPSIKGEKIDLSFMDSIDNEDLVKHGDEMGLKMEEDSNSEIKLDEKVIKEELMDKDDSGPPSKLFRGMQYKFWSPGCIVPPTRYKKPSDREITEMVFRTGVTVMPARLPDDLRKCSLCHSQGDGIADGPARLLNYDVDKWVHLNCALWSDGVYETVNGALMNFDNVLQTCSTSTCVFCERNGATVRCFKTRCTNIYHLSCAVKHKCVFHKNKTAHCPSHIPKGEKENELTTLSVQRRVYVQRDESRQVAAVMQLAEPTYLLRVGGLIFLSVGQLLPHQLPAFHSPNYIYPIGYQTIRFYWSTKRINTRCRYICSIVDKGGRPEFVVTPQEGEAGAAESRGSTPRGAWAPLLNALSSLRATQDTLRLWPDHLTGEDLFGLTEPAIVRVLESLPGIDTLTDYRFKYGRNPLLELPLAVNPSGAARTEARAAARGAQWRRALAVRAPPPAPRLPALPLAPPPPPGEHACPYSKQFVHSKSSQYKKMKQEWRNNVYLARSKIQGLGLYAARDIEKHTMVIEYIGEVIRSELSEIREKKYEDRNRGIYMFRLDEERVVDATLSGGLARYINHSCNPNCVAEAVEVERDLRIIIFAKRRINRGEELAYDYKFDIEDDAHKISCMCGAPNCRKWMN